MFGLDMWEVFMAWVKFVREDIEIEVEDGISVLEASARNFLVVSDAPLNAKPSTIAQNRTPR